MSVLTEIISFIIFDTVYGPFSIFYSKLFFQATPKRKGIFADDSSSCVEGHGHCIIAFIQSSWFLVDVYSLLTSIML